MAPQNLFQRRQLLRAGKGFDVPGKGQRLFLFDLPAVDVTRQDRVQPPGGLTPKAVRIEPGFRPQT